MIRVSSRQRIANCFVSTTPPHSDSRDGFMPLKNPAKCDDLDTIMAWPSMTKEAMPLSVAPNPPASPHKSPITVPSRKRERRSSSSGTKTSVSIANLVLKLPTPPIIVRADNVYEIIKNDQKESSSKSSASSPGRKVLPQDGKKNLEFDDVMDDAMLHILSFLSGADVRSVSATCQHIHGLIFSVKARHLWVDLCRRQWPWLGALHQADNKLAFRDDSAIVVRKMATDDKDQEASFHANLSVLLGMSAQSQPLQLTLPMFCYPSPSRPNERPRSRLMLRDTEFRKFEMRKPLTDSSGSQLQRPRPDSTPVGVIQYTGTVGSGNRCIRADHPLPRVAAQTDPSSKRKWCTSSPLTNALLDFFCKCVRETHDDNAPHLRPFVSPYVTEGTKKEDTVEINLTPRLVSYFEITVLERDEEQEPQAASTRRGRTGRNTENRTIPPAAAPDCIAIGLSAESSQIQTEMPGWDSLSFGYHGDDGGIFHGTGDVIRQFGPSFGAGDTVGCGIDFVNRGIFFTHNGEFLGYAWTGLDDEIIIEDLYPTVGVDSNCPVAWNFGDKPFAYDLKVFNEQHEAVIEASLSHLKAAPSSRNMSR